MLFRNIIAWDTSFRPAKKSDKWVELPGPAWLWPDNYDFERFGWESTEGAMDAKGVYKFIVNRASVEETPKQFSSLLKSVSVLRWKRPGEVDFFDL